MKKIILSLTIGFSLSSIAWAEPQRIAVLSADVGEIVVALGESKKVVGRDQVDKNPALKNVPVVAMHRSVAAETVMSVKPDLVIGSWSVQPPTVFEQLQKTGVKAVNVMPEESVANFANGIRQIGKLIGKPQQANNLANQWQSAMTPKAKTGKRYILSYDGLYVAGKGTAGDAIIQAAGGVNAANVSGLRPLSREGWLAAKADVIIIAEHNLKQIGGLNKFLARPEIAANPAAKHQKVIALSANEFLRYGLNTPKTVQKLQNLAK